MATIALYAIEILANCARGNNICHFAKVFLFLDHTDQIVRLSAMSTISNLSRERIHDAYGYMEDNKDYDNHITGLLSLLNSDALTYSEVKHMIEDNDAIVRKHGIIIAKKLYKKFPKLMNEAVKDQDLDIKEFSKIVIKVKLEIKDLRKN